MKNLEFDAATASPRDRLVCAADFARILGCSRKTLDRMRARRPFGFPAEHNMSASDHPRASRPYYLMSEIRAFIAARAE